MFVLKYQQPEEATADVAKIYNIFQQKRTQVPAPLQLMSTSPEMLNLVFSQISYFMHHPTLSFPLLAAIRLLAAQHGSGDLGGVRQVGELGVHHHNAGQRKAGLQFLQQRRADLLGAGA